MLPQDITYSKPWLDRKTGSPWNSFCALSLGCSIKSASQGSALLQTHNDDCWLHNHINAVSRHGFMKNGPSAKRTDPTFPSQLFLLFFLVGNYIWSLSLGAGAFRYHLMMTIIYLLRPLGGQGRPKVKPWDLVYSLQSLMVTINHHTPLTRLLSFFFLPYRKSPNLIQWNNEDCCFGYHFQLLHVVFLMERQLSFFGSSPPTTRIALLQG